MSQIVKQAVTIKFVKLNGNRKIASLLAQIARDAEERVGDEQKQQFVEYFQQDILSIKALIYQNWVEFNSFVMQFSSQITSALKEQYDEQVRQRLKAHIFTHRIKNHDWTFNRYHNLRHTHQDQATMVRKKSEEEQQGYWDYLFPIENVTFFEEWNKSIKIFEEIYETGNVMDVQPVPPELEHHVILVHGFQAHQNDLLNLKMCL